MKPQLNSILKSPSEPGEGKVPLSTSFQGANLKRRVSFGPEHIHEFTVDSTFSQGNNSLSSTIPNYTTLSNNQYTPKEESMELTNVANNEMDVNFLTDQLRDIRAGSTVHPILCGRDLPVQEPTRTPLKVWNTNRNNQLPANPLCSDKQLKSPFRGGSVGNSTQPEGYSIQANAVPNPINQTEISMELTCMNQINNQTVKIIESEQPHHLSPNPVDTSRMSWLNNSQYFDILDETPDKTSDSQIIPSDSCVSTDTPRMPREASGMSHDIFSMVVDTLCKEKNTPTPFHPSFSNCSNDFSGLSYKEKSRYHKYLAHKAKIAKLRPEVNRLLREVEELKEEKLRLENEISRQVMVVAALKDELAAKKAENLRKRTAIIEYIRTRLLSCKDEFIKIQNS